MSDVTVNTETPLAQPVPEADVTTKIESPVAETPPVEQEAEVKPEGEKPPAEQGEPEGEEQRKRPTGSERLKRQLARAQATADELARELEDTRRRTASDGGTPQGKPGTDRAPTEGDFPNDYLAFEAAKTEWNVRQAVRQELGKSDVQRRDAQLREVHRERVELYEESVAEVRERIPDFDKVIAEAKGVNVSNALADEIMQSDKSALLQYHLAQKPDLVRELNALSGRALAKEIGKLEARVHLPQPKKATDATPPPSVVKGAAAQAVDPVAGPDDMNAYVAWRRKQSA